MPTTAPDARAIAAAAGLLGIAAGASWGEIRAAYRTRIRLVHPDVAPHNVRATTAAAELNRALATLRIATADGRVTLPAFDLPHDSPPTPAPTPSSDGIVLHAPPGDVFIHLLDALHDLGEVCYVDPEAGLIQVLLADIATPARLLVAVEAETTPPRVSFTLDTDQAENAPSLPDVVADLGRLLERARSPHAP